jgi:anthranilate phosphoribosyltransferase
VCQKLVGRVAQAQQLMAVADPELLALFEEWLDELEAEVISLVQGQAALTARDLAAKCGLSHRGATFLLSKLQREGKLS